MDDLLTVTEQRFTGDEEFLAPTDAIFNALSSLNSSCEDTSHIDSSGKKKKQKLSGIMATGTESNGDTGSNSAGLTTKDGGLSDFEQRLLEEPIDQEINVGADSKTTPSSARRVRGRGRCL